MLLAAVGSGCRELQHACALPWMRISVPLRPRREGARRFPALQRRRGSTPGAVRGATPAAEAEAAVAKLNFSRSEASNRLTIF